MKTTYEFPKVKNHFLPHSRHFEAAQLDGLYKARYPGRHPSEGVPLAALVREPLPLASLVGHAYGEEATMVLEGN
jgi:hypothetical protein